VGRSRRSVHSCGLPVNGSMPDTLRSFVPLRIAFLTNEFIIESPSHGGLGNYVNRITKALKGLGHEPEIFVLRSRPDTDTVMSFDGIRVEHVAAVDHLGIRLLRRLEARYLAPPWGGAAAYLGTALGLSRALARRHAEHPFHIVHSTNCGAAGLFVRRRTYPVHIIRLSSHRTLWWQTDGTYRLGHKLIALLERTAVRNATIAYAPSQFVADHCRHSGWRGDVQVVRPPAFLEVAPAVVLDFPVPERYLIHFGQIGRRKGSDLVAAALLRAWEEDPTLTMVWCGAPIDPREMERFQASWGARSGNVVWLSALPRPLLYAVLRRALAAVLPSRIDNLPNTVIEALLLGVPVIGSDGASIDELVEPGVNGELVPVGDVAGLVSAMLRAWRGEACSRATAVRSPRRLADLDPERAAAALVRLATGRRP